MRNQESHTSHWVYTSYPGAELAGPFYGCKCYRVAGSLDSHPRGQEVNFGPENQQRSSSCWDNPCPHIEKVVKSWRRRMSPGSLPHCIGLIFAHLPAFLIDGIDSSGLSAPQSNSSHRWRMSQGPGSLCAYWKSGKSHQAAQHFLVNCYTLPGGTQLEDDLSFSKQHAGYWWCPAAS